MPILKIRSPATLFSAFLISGCSTLFLDEFEAEGNGDPPLASPPGAPVGDVVQATPGTGTIQVLTSDAVEGQGSLAIGGPGILSPLESDPSPPSAVFRAVPAEDNLAPIYFRWQGQLDGEGSLNADVVSLGHLLVRLRFDGGQIFLDNVPVGTFGPGVHNVIVSVFPSSDRFDALISGDVQIDGTVISGPVLDIEGTPATEYILEVDLVTPEDDTVYRMDNIQISQRVF